ncbi:peptidyl-tRNA hydrolase, chloroplastic isoform X2 [Physcomitrium patens]|uniref:peptidyl-tRNA hydrolase, chloroplastic isoform X2 n=1 Tax=Physcomitrium patens TaxID=3218 RepID=UPI000D166F73|nr:peptidyl-tRNA hydrolase, chloroplastic-like isoform X2 [Physcomitrium patens]|eukprot:XP_024374494.1 peptidyl-tRNA hydrolase, chloroplastic-like isoform X2 [Physcomitrella patens]
MGTMMQQIQLQRQTWMRSHRWCNTPAPLGGSSLAVFLLPCPRSSPSSLSIRACSSSPSNNSPSSSPALGLPWLIVGLGNPGSKFVGTRHNLVRAGFIGPTPVLLAKPHTYMNLSGESVGPISTYYKIPRERVLAIYDDLELEFAMLRILPRGGHGGHNGMRSLIEHFGGKQDFPRLRFGVGRPECNMDPSAYVLQKFNPRERKELDEVLQRGVEGVRLLMTEGLQKTVTTWNLHRKSRLEMIKELE